MKYTDSCKIPAIGGALYSGRFRYQDASLETKVSAALDESVKAIGFGYFPKALLLTPSLTIEATFGPVSSRSVQTGIIDSVERVGGNTMAVIHFLDTAMTTDLGTISDLTVIDNGSGSVVLTWTPVDGVTSYQARVDTVNAGSSVLPESPIIVLNGLAAGSKSFTIDATDGVTTTTSNAAIHVVT